MADEADLSAERMEFLDGLALKGAVNKPFAVGVAGDCDDCGEFFPRVVAVELHDEILHLCGKCRDRNKVA